ncbi:MAG: pyrroline-5-carboxylate reductase [Spirochaetes bacterium]|nr:pyrroline-5-carboxylate reductase [Spirochaetota bacterium]
MINLNIKIGCLGTGNMGGAILSRISKKINRDNIFCYDADKLKAKSIARKLRINISESESELAGSCDVIIIGVKPDVVPAVLRTIKYKSDKKIIISIAAGVKTENISKELNSSAEIIRIMPNMPALIGEGMSVISSGENASETSIATANAIFSCIGKVLVLPEKMMDAVTAMSGSGPAYAFTMIQGMADGGVKAGLSRKDSLLLAAQTLLGAAKMVIESGEDPIVLRDKIASPGGTTIEAIHILEKAGFSGILMDAVEGAKNKSEKLGKKLQ